jgi:hypothetical protein
VGELLGLLGSRESSLHDHEVPLSTSMTLSGLAPLVDTIYLAGVTLNAADIRFAVQAAFAAYSVPAQSDKFYDLAGSLGFISTTLVSLVRHLHSSAP